MPQRSARHDGRYAYAAADYGSTRPRIDMPRLLDMYMDGKLKIDELVSRTFTLAQVNEAYQALKEGGVARSVVKFF